MARRANEVQGRIVDFGVDTGLIDSNHRLPVEERMRRHNERVRMYQRMKQRTLSPIELSSIRQAQVEEAIRR